MAILGMYTYLPRDEKDGASTSSLDALIAVVDLARLRFCLASDGSPLKFHILRAEAVWKAGHIKPIRGVEVCAQGYSYLTINLIMGRCVLLSQFYK